MTMRSKNTRAPGKRENYLSTNPPPRVPRSAFNRSYSLKTTFESGVLVPVHVDEVLPGDTINLRSAYFCRMATPLTVPFDGIHLETQTFFVPLRQLWDNFVLMMGERVDPDDHNSYTVPQITSPSGGWLANTLGDYMGIPIAKDITVNALFFRAYNHIWNTWYRDADIQDSVVVDRDDGPDTETDYVLLRRGKRKGYLSGARPFAQRGDEVTMPLGSSAPVSIVADSTGYPTFDSSGGGTDIQLDKTTGSPERVIGTGLSTGNLSWGDPHLEGTADLSSATAATINVMREALATQHLLERDARGGGRYWEIIHSHFGVTPDHIRLERPELLGTQSIRLNTTPVPQTSENVSLQRTGDLAGFTTGLGVGRPVVKSFEEHGIVMTLASVRADLSFQQGVHRMFTRQTRYDHFWPDFAHLGEQAVLNREVYYNNDAQDTETWGFQPRFEEYRHRDSMITGEFRSDHTTPLDFWHLGIDFGTTRPNLNAAFIEENPPISRVLSLSGSTQFLLDCFHQLKHVRPMPRFATPGLMRF